MDEDARTPLFTWTKNDHFGEVVFLEGANDRIYPASVKAETPLDLIVLERADFTGLAESPGTLQRGLEQVCSHPGLRTVHNDFGQKSCRRAFAISDVMSRAVQTLPVKLSFAETVEKFQAGSLPSHSRCN
jgi:hypothetical protein